MTALVELIAALATLAAKALAAREAGDEAQAQAIEVEAQQAAADWAHERGALPKRLAANDAAADALLQSGPKPA